MLLALYLEVVHPREVASTMMLDVDSVTRIDNRFVRFVIHHGVGENIKEINVVANCKNKKEVNRKYLINSITGINAIRLACYYSGHDKNKPVWQSLD